MSSQLVALLVGFVLCFVAACSSPSGVRLGMSMEDVVGLLGKPDRESVLIGKVLEDPRDVAAEQTAGHRRVFIYEASGIEVWFLDGRVTGMTENGVAVQLDAASPREPEV